MSAAQASLRRNASWMAFGQGFSFLVQGAYFVLLARLLKVEQYGVFVGVMASVSLVSQYGSLGTGLLLVRNVSREHARFAESWGNLLLTTLAVGSLMVGLTTLLGSHFVGVQGRPILLYVAFSECIFTRISEGAGQAFQSVEDFRYSAALSAMPNTARLLIAMTLLLGYGHATVTQWAVAVLAASSLTSLAALLLVTFHLGRPRFSVRSAWRQGAEGFGFAFASSTTSIYNDVDKAMLSHYNMPVANGIYAMAYRVVDISCTPIRSLHSAAFPRFCQTGAHGIENSLPLARSILKKTLTYCVVLAAILFIGAPLVPVVVGKGFIESQAALRWLCLIPIFRSLHLSAGDMLTGAGYQRYRTGAQLLAAVVNICLNILWIPAFSWRGAAWSSLMTDGLLAALNWSIVLWMRRSEAMRAAESYA